MIPRPAAASSTSPIASRNTCSVFSEDLDFTLKDESHLDEAFLKAVFAEIGEWVYEQGGLEVPADRQDFDIYDNPRGHENCQGKISYRGPVSPTTSGWPRIKLDLTADERLVLPPVLIPIFHPYSDAPDQDIIVQAYADEEAFGEKRSSQDALLRDGLAGARIMVIGSEDGLTEPRRS